METRGEAAIRTAFRMLVGAVPATLVLIIGLGAAASAQASVGELEQIGSFGPGTEQFEWPQDLAVDTSDNNVFVLDAPGAPEGGSGPLSFRVREFSAKLGAAIASASVPTPLVEGEEQMVEGMAVDPTLHRLYVLKGAHGEKGRFFATEIDAYSTEPTELPSGEKTLEPAENVPGGVYYRFPHKAGGEPDELKEPHGLAVDPHTDDLIVLGEQASGGVSTALQRIHGVDQGAFSAEFVDNSTPKVLTEEGTAVDGLAVGPDGSVYFVTRGLPSGLRGIAKLSPDFSTATIVHEEEYVSGSVPMLTGGRSSGRRRDYGPQIAVAPEGNLVYATETDKEAEGLTRGSYEIRGMSTEAGPGLGTQEVVLGGGSGGHCEIASNANALAAGSGGVVYALDEGAFEGGAPTPYGFDLVKFGPSGSGCPTPLASFTINGKPGSQKVTITKGEKVQFEALTAGLNGETPSELEWSLEGDGKYSKEPGADLKASMWYSKPGKYDIGLRVLLEHGGSFGEPGPASGEIEVVGLPPSASFEPSATSAKPGETVTFDGSGSFDPTGLCVPAEEVCERTHTLEKYLWTFGDGQTKETTTASYGRSFENPSSEARTESVTLTVTNGEDVQSSPTTEYIAILGTPASGGSNGGTPGGGPGPSTSIQTPGPGPAVTGVVTPKVLTSKQKLDKALAACKKIKPKDKRVRCEKLAKRRYGPKGASHKRHGKKK